MKAKGRSKKGATNRGKDAEILDHPAFGIWADREDMKDVEAWLRKIRTPRYMREGGSLSSPPRKRQSRKRNSKRKARD